MPERRKLQFVDAKLIGTALMWWQQYKKSYAKANLSVISTWDEMKAAISKRVQPQDYW